MKILVLHNRYHYRGGEDTVVDLETSHLVARGHDVLLKTVLNDDISGLASKVRTMFEVAGSWAAESRVDRWISEFEPDVVHVHNFFPRLSPSAHLAAARMGIAVVQTLHNFRLLCAGALLMRDGQICEDCLGGMAWPALRHRCYRGSLPGTGAVVAMQRATTGSDRWLRSVDRFIALTEFGRDKFIAGGLPAEKIAVKPNFVASSDVPRPLAERSGGAIFVGRLSSEKGALDLVRAWRNLPEIPLDVIGDGPDLDQLRNEAPPNVRLIGRMPYADTQEAIGNARVLVFPSRWYETFGMTLVEAMAAGTPIVAARLGAAEAILKDRPFARLYTPGDATALVSAVRDLVNDQGNHARAARETYLSLYSPEQNMVQLEAIYADAIRQRKRAGDNSAR